MFLTFLHDGSNQVQVLIFIMFFSLVGSADTVFISINPHFQDIAVLFTVLGGSIYTLIYTLVFLMKEICDKQKIYF